jgi:hypothetical protein
MHAHLDGWRRRCRFILLFALAGAERDAGNKDKALDYAQRLVAVAPPSREAHELLQSLGGDNVPTFH